MPMIGNVYKAYKRYGLTEAQILRIATLGNMEILGLDKELGSIEPNKFTDLVLLGKNPLNHIDAIQDVKMVFKDGKLVVNHVTNNVFNYGK